MSNDRSDAGTDATLAANPDAAPTVASEPVPSSGPPSISGYELGDLIGSGGMGEVVTARDPRIGREIAVKRMRASGNAELRSRFLREARIQARLEHPAIVPVHEIGHAADGSPYFTMKRITGTTLLDLIPRESETQRLLRALVDVCLAVELAHARGVVHRDLKPANIILGELGEVYVLDWGIARVIAEREAASSSDIESLSGMTSAGALLGTPGYMAPEQIADAARAGTAADVYALGSILFEILTREPLHVRGLPALAATIAGVDGSPRRRRPGAGIPPELDALCVEALSLDPANRPTARVLADRLQRYLDGDRDVTRRRALASEYLAAAREALADPRGGRHVEAMRLAGSAVALDPDSHEAVAAFARIMLEPPRVLPEGLRAALAASDTATQRRQSRVAAMSFLACAAFLVAIGLEGIRDWPLWGALAGLTGVMAVSAVSMMRRSPGTRSMILVLLGNALLASLLSRAFGSLILAPAVTCVMALSLTSYPQLIERGKLVIAVLGASWLVPVVLERLALLEPTWSVDAGVVRSTSSLCEIHGSVTAVLLVAANLIAIVVIGLFANALATARRNAQRTIEIQAWHMRQLVPETSPA